MLVRYEERAGPVVALHPRRPWLAAPRSGALQIINYATRATLQHPHHGGAVTALEFHPSLPLLASGNAEGSVAIWNHDRQSSVCVLSGHTGSVRSLSFHVAQPWIASGSSDLTVRIWNWQARSCLSVLAGHTHEVSCCRFHAMESILVSASWDTTVRVWDVSGLLRATTLPSSQPSATGPSATGPVGADLLGHMDVYLQCTFEAHSGSVHSVALHPSERLCVTASQDRTVRLWRLDGSTPTEEHVFVGHKRSVSCAVFDWQARRILSVSEDNCLCVWDTQPPFALLRTVSDHDKKLRTLTTSRYSPMIASGSEICLTVFKLDRERPAFALHDSLLYYIQNNYLRCYNCNTAEDHTKLQLSTSQLKGGIDCLSFNPTENGVVLSSRGHGQYEFFSIPRTVAEAVVQPRRGNGTFGTWTAHNRFAVLEAGGQIPIKALHNENNKVVRPSMVGNRMISAEQWHVFLISPSVVQRLDLQHNKIVHSIEAAGVKSVLWSPQRTRIALLSKKSIIVCDISLQMLYQLNDSRVKSATFLDEHILMYTTHFQVKYLLPNGEAFTVCSLETPMYLVSSRASGSNSTALIALDRTAAVRVIPVDLKEIRLKLALALHDFHAVLSLVHTAGLPGQALLRYFASAGYAEAALHFVKNPATRFRIAIKCFNIPIAVESAHVVNRAECWRELAEAALWTGDHQTAELAYQRARDYSRLAYLYFYTGNLQKLRSMLKIAELRKDIQSRACVSILLGDVKSLADSLLAGGSSGLAFLSSSVIGLPFPGAQTATMFRDQDISSFQHSPWREGHLVQPPQVLFGSQSRWPQLHQDKGFFDISFISVAARHSRDAPASNTSTTNSAPTNESEATEGMPSSLRREEPEGGSLVAQLALSGNIQLAMERLKSELGIVVFTPLRSRLVALGVLGHVSVPCISCFASLQWRVPLQLRGSLASINEALLAGYAAFGRGRFVDVLSRFRNVLYEIPFLVLEEAALVEIQQVIAVCREYITASMIELRRRELAQLEVLEELSLDHNAQLATLAAYITRCDLSCAHLLLCLPTAMALSFKVQCYRTAAHFAQRLLDLGPKPELRAKAIKILQHCMKTDSDAIKLNFDLRNPFVVCVRSFAALYQGRPQESCPFCRAVFDVKFKGNLCAVCEVAEVGRMTSGLRIGIQKDTRD
eukprot:m.274726 g.274726  ORF g.274726 m.274726 type:complete len:1165 (-) comp54837_c0_seq6:8-3502(-)